MALELKGAGDTVLKSDAFSTPKPSSLPDHASAY